jgi:hypothetical protein
MMAVIGVGSQFLATLHRRLWSVLLVCCMCLAGIAACIALLVWIDITELRSFVDGGKDEVVQRSVNVFVTALIAWFSGFMATQLGISVQRPLGALKKIGKGIWRE